MREWLPAAVIFGLLLLAGLRQGGFWSTDALVVGLVSLVVVVAGVILNPPERRSLLLVGSVLLLALWWLLRALTSGSQIAFLPLGASMLAFAAGFVATSRLRDQARQWAGLGVACLGAAGALIGLVGLICRWFPMAIPAQGLWREATTLTYSDAAGLVLGMSLLIAFGTECCPALVRVAVCLNTAGVLATQSRGAYLAVICGLFFVPWRRLALWVVPVLAGVTLGVAAIVSSPDPGAVPWLGGVLAATVLVAAATPWNMGGFRVSGRVRVVLLAVLASAAMAALALMHHEIALRALAPSDQDRSVEWSTALHQWGTSPIVGVGPDRLLVFHAGDGTIAHFVHNEYLQIATDAGAIGLALLGLSGVSVGRVVRRFDPLASCAVGAIVCWAMAGAFDFDWHLSVVGLLGGCCVGLAAPGDARGRGDSTPEVRQSRIPIAQAPMAGASGSESWALTR